MFNISQNTVITGYQGKAGTLSQALCDKNLHRNLNYDYFGKRVQRGSIDVFFHGGWHFIRFDCENGWARSIEVI